MCTVHFVFSFFIFPQYFYFLLNNTFYISEISFTFQNNLYPQKLHLDIQRFMNKTKDFLSQLKEKKIITQAVESSVAKLLPAELELSTLPAKISQLIHDGKIECEMGKMLLQNMAKDEGIKRLISPHLQLQLFCYKVLQLLGANSQNSEELEAIKENLNKKIPMKEFFSSVYEQFTGSKMEENDLQDLLKEMESDHAFYNRYIKGEREEEQPKEQKVEMFDGFDINDLQQYQQELTEDLNEIPENMDQYKLKKIQIKMCKLVVDRRSEPTQLQQEDREYLQKMDLKHEEATLARDMIFNGKDIRRNLKILRYYRCGIDIQDVFRMIRIGRKKNQQLNQKQKVILFMGLSKAGKTTIITRLVGYDMHLTRINGIYTLQPKNKVNQKHQSLKIGYSNRSTTRYPSTFEVNKSFVENEAVKVMDSPGFQDTGSVQIEISNRITTIEALKQVSNLQIVIVINQKNWGVSGADVQKLAKTVSSICSNYKSIRKSITFAFNQFDQRFAESFENQVEDLIRNIKARKGPTNNDGFDSFFEHLLKESRNYKKNLVEPQRLDQAKFLERLLEKDWIQNPRVSLVCDIGFKAKDEVKKLCKRYVAEFERNYEKKQLKEAQYCLEMLKKMQDEPNLQSDSEYQIQQILDKLKKGLENKYNKMNNEFQQLFTRTINDKNKRGENYKRLKEELSEFEKQIQKYRAIDGKYEKDLKSIYEEVESFYVIKMNEWRSQECSLHKLQQATITGIEFFQFFLPDKCAAFKEKLTNQATELQSHITLQIKNLNQSSSFYEDLKKLTALGEVLGGWDPCIFENQLKQEFKMRVDSIRFIDFSNSQSTRWSDWIKQEYDYDNQFLKLSHLADFLSAVLKYPKQVIKQQEMTKIQSMYKYIVQTLPKNTVKEFENETKVEQAEEDEEMREQKMQQKMQQQHNKKQAKINKIKTLMRWMKGLNSIQVIRKFDDNRFEKTFLSLNSMIEHSMTKFSSVSQALSQNNLQKMKIIMRTAKSEFKQLKSLVQAADKQELIDKFNKMEEKVIDCMQQYIIKNEYEEILKFSKLKELSNCIQSYKNLKIFKGLLFLDNQSLKGELDKKFKSYEAKILEPINSYSSEIEELKQKGNKFKVSKHESYLIYCEKIKDVGNNLFNESFKKQFDSKQNEIKKNSQYIIKSQIEDPLTAFSTKLQQMKQLNLEAISLDLQEQFKTNKISKIKRAFEFLSEILKSEKVSEYNEGDDLKEISQTNLREQDQLQKSIRQKIETNQISINGLDLIQKIVDKINFFGTRNEAICQQYKSISNMIRGKQAQLNQSSQARKQQLINRYKDGVFDEEAFISIWNGLSQDQTENGDKSRSQLVDLLQRYRRDTEKLLNDLKELMYEDSSDYLLKSLKTLNKFGSFANKIKQNFKDQPIVKETTLSNYEDTISMINQAIPSFLDTFQNISSLTTKQLQQLRKQTFKIEQEIKEIGGLGIIFEQVKKNREQKNIASFQDLLKNQKKLKDEKIKKIKSERSLGDLVDDDFPTFFSSLEEPQRKEVTNSIKTYFKIQMKKMSESYYQDCQEFDNKNRSLDNFIRNLPTELSSQLADEKDKQFSKVQQKENGQIKEIFEKKEENNQDQLLNILNFCEKRKKSNNAEKIQRRFLQKYDYVKKQDNEGVIKAFLNMLWKHKDKFSSIEILNKQYLSLEKGCLERIKHISERCWKNILDNYKNVSQNDWDSSQNDDLSQRKSIMITSKITKTRSRIGRAINCYETVADGIEKGLVLRQNSQLITNCKNQMQKSFSALIERFMKLKNGLRQINDGVISKQSSMIDIFGIYPQVLQDTAALKSQNNQSTSLNSFFLNKGFNLNDFQKEICEQKQNLFKKVDKLYQLKFEYFSDSLKNQSDKDSQKRVTQFEQKIQFLENLMNAGYNKLKPPTEIRIQDEIVKNLEKQAEINTELVLKLIDKIVDPEDVEDDTISEQVNSIPKIMQVINSKQRSYMPKQNHLKTIQDKLNEVCRKVKQGFNQSLTNLLDKNTKARQEFNVYSKKEEDSAKTLIREQQEKHEIKKKEKQEQYQKKLQNMSGEDKKKMEKQMQSQLKVIESESDRKIEDINQKLRDKKQKFMQSKNKEEQNLCKQFLNTLIVIKKLGLVFLIKDDANKTIQSGLKKLAKTKLVQKVFELLSNSKLSICEQIKESDAFQKMRGQEFASKTASSNNIEFVLEKMRRQGKIDYRLKQLYTSFYQVFDQEQNKYIESYKKSRDKTVIHTLKMKIKEEGFAMETKLKSKECINGSQKVSVLAKIFALWSISISESDGDDQQQFFVSYKAHAAQITAILLIICIQSNQNSNEKGIPTNRLAEVKTGEGKSIVLAGLSIYFALLGYDVDCCCYSENLSKRDEIAFSKLFKDCGVDKKIKYGIFDHVIRNLLNKKSETEVFKLQDTIKQALLADIGWFNKFVNFFTSKFPNFKDLSGGKDSKKVLIIDEIDVLFDRNYFGETFNQTVEIKDPTIKQLFLFIWQNKKNIGYKTIKDSKEFKSVVEKYKPLSALLENQIYGMLAALETYEEQQYVIIDRKIMYKVEDTLQEVSYGYNTVYAYTKEYSNGQISEAALNQHLAITLCVSQFSYSRIPEFYTHIVGVTGTLVCLPQYIKDYLRQKYRIFEGDMYPIPSVYSKQTEKEEASNRTIFEAIATKQEDHYEKIIANFEPEFTKGRPILIFFRSKSELLQFYQSPLFAKYLKNTSYLTEEHNMIQRQDRISRSSRKNTITLMTSSYIRGIDFKLNNKMAKTLGGFHAVVTYVIESIADFIQVTGRVARQGQDGSIIQIFPASQLTLLNIDPITSPSNELLKRKRLLKQQQEKDTCLQRLSAANKRHQQTMKVFNDDNINQSKLIEYVQSKNKFPQISDNKGRLLFLVDATISMGSMFAKLKLILPNIFADVYDTLKNKNFKGQLEMQIIFYRNYNVGFDKLIEISPFDNTGNSLKQFVTNSKVSGGWGNEAIEVGLQYANTLVDIGEIFIIGDARGNTPAEVKQKRLTYPNLESERIQKALYLTTTEDQLDKLVKKGVKISSFYLSKISDVSNYFEKLALCTGGKAVYVDVASKQSAGTMTQIVAESGLKLIGGSKDADVLLQEYKQILKRRLAK